MINFVLSSPVNSQTKADKFTNATATPGIDFEVTNVRELLASGEERITPVYTLPLCAYSFKVSISFNSEGHLIMFLIVTPSEYADNSLTNPISVCGKAYILNKGSHSYSKIWDLSMETDAACKSITAEKEVKIEAKVSLKTCKSKLDVVKLEDLETRNFLFDNSIFIKWMVEPFDILSGSLGSDDKPGVKTGAGNAGAKKATNAKGKSEKNQKTNAKKPPKSNLTYSFLSEKKDVHIGESTTAETPGDSDLVVDVMPFPESGEVFTVTKISELLSSNTPQQTQTFSLTSCPCVFRLCVSFTDKKLMKVELVVVRVRQNVSMKWPLYVSSHGYITNGDGANSMLWEIPFEKKLTKFRIGDEKKLTMPICLRSPSGDLKEMSLEELEARGFVRDDTLTISWLVSAMGSKEFLEQKSKSSSPDGEIISPDVKNENITSPQDARWVIS